MIYYRLKYVGNICVNKDKVSSVYTYGIWLDIEWK